MRRRTHRGISRGRQLSLSLWRGGIRTGGCERHILCPSTGGAEVVQARSPSEEVTSPAGLGAQTFTEVVGNLKGDAESEIMSIRKRIITLSLMFGVAVPFDLEWRRKSQDTHDQRAWAILVLEQAERILQEERHPLRFAHGALVIGHLVGEIEPERARRLLRAAAEALAQVDFETLADRMVRFKQRAAFHTPYDVDLLWETLLERAATSDVEFLEEVLTRLKADAVWKARAIAAVARSLADDHKTNEQKLRDLATLSLKHAVTFPLVDLLFRLKRRNPSLADTLFRSALHQAAIRKDLEGLYWLGAYAIPGVNLPNRFPLADPPPPDAHLARMYLDVLVEQLAHVAFSTSRIPSHIYWALVNIHPQAEQFAPQLLGRIESLLTFVASRLPASAIARIERRDQERLTPAEKKAEDLIARAHTARDDPTHDALMANAAHLLAGRGDFERALSAASRIRDRELRKEMTDLIRLEAVAHFLQKDSLEEAETHALAVEHAERSVIAAAQILERLKEPERRTELLARLQNRLEQVLPQEGKARAQLYLATALLPHDPPQGEMALVRAIDLFNKTHLDLDGTGAGIKIEIRDFVAVRGVGSQDLAPLVIRAFQSLARSEHEPSRLAVLASSWTNPEIRAIAQAALAVAVLERLKRDAQDDSRGPLR